MAMSGTGMISIGLGLSMLPVYGSMRQNFWEWLLTREHAEEEPVIERRAGVLSNTTQVKRK